MDEGAALLLILARTGGPVGVKNRDLNERKPACSKIFKNWDKRLLAPRPGCALSVASFKGLPVDVAVRIAGNVS